MTLGSASPASAGSATQRIPAGACVDAATSASIDRELEWKMGEHVRHHAGQRPPTRLHARQPRRGGERVALLEVAGSTRWSAPRSCRRAAPWAGASAGARTHLREETTKAAPRRRRPAAFGALRGNVSDRRANAPRNAPIHGQSTQAGFFGVQMVAPRSISACAKSPARADGHQALRRGAGCPALAAGNSSSTANSRATTRSTLPSTAAAGASKAMAAIAAAV